jgi:hypothetical protein
MSTIFKVFFTYLIIMESIYARSIVLINHENRPTELKSLIKVLTENFNFPMEVIQVNNFELKNVKSSKAILSFEINDKGEIFITSLQGELLKSTFKEFIKRNETQKDSENEAQ